MVHVRIIIALFFLFSLISCGHAATEISEEDPYTVLIYNHMFVPTTLTVAPGETVFFYNQDSMAHRILSASGEDLFDDSGLFDSTIIPDGDVYFITIPDTALDGEVFYFYDDYLQDEMITPNGIITISE